ncbi:hypothetical protein BX616_006975 [Lobosporangium transversale]|uniref:RING-type domain-containing protein n=1 Tax=Lobosporangium transversale TaxID=64571 RepID=A0A1Y2GWE0_9FUNG|nr:hypothetical protein BCR41DRAFT_320933 [Lobosporangium transversale]KAF9915062.1 hypothetical protein BX616_006975 [Lobosporangium transversale]ORZ21013.1 hypothetical protein BCR41DRAFT_320933 [Lobosporangium transversale]|eukprot:XP_021882922.1 hypothetical protein BCR41DRAFT_320933 [Lobosporangium transversale]
MSRHSKNNTARGHFTYAEKQMVDYGSKKQRLGRDSMRDFDACYLCLQTARDPVCCTEGHLSCKECIYENILAQKMEIERQAKLSLLYQSQEAQEQQMREELAQQIILTEFERNQMGVSSSKAKPTVKREKPSADSPTTTTSSNTTPRASTDSQQNSKKRRFELDLAELEKMSKQERLDIAKAIEEEAKAKKPALPSFWVPSLTPSTKQSEFKPTKVHTVCTATDNEHKLSLKNLIPVKFELAIEDHDETEAGQVKTSSICPICRKGFTNTTKMSILKSCGHVFCESCCKKFIKKEGRCQSCDHKTKEKDIITMRGEGSGFSGGGAKEAVKFDVAFQ